MNRLLEWLQGGDLRSDGLSGEVVRFVLDHPELLEDLLTGLTVNDEVVRGRAADAIEHIARVLPEKLLPHYDLIAHTFASDPIPMVRWHLAMVIGHLALDVQDPEGAFHLLSDRLVETSVFVVSWVIVSLCIYARLYPDLREGILDQVTRLGANESAAIRSKVQNAMRLLSNEMEPFPKGWVKSERIQRAISKN
jgi:hypothetical protein